MFSRQVQKSSRLPCPKTSKTHLIRIIGNLLDVSPDHRILSSVTLANSMRRAHLTPKQAGHAQSRLDRTSGQIVITCLIRQPIVRFGRVFCVIIVLVVRFLRASFDE